MEAIRLKPGVRWFIVLADGDLQVLEQAVVDVINPPVQIETLTPSPGILDGGCVCDVHHLLLYVELTQAAKK